MLDIQVDDLSSGPTQELLTIHLAGMHENSPPGHVFALDLSELRARNVTVWSAWDGSALAGIYRKHGFVDGEAFGDYRRSDFNQFLHLTL